MASNEEAVRVLEILAPTIHTHRQFESKLATCPDELKQLVYDVCRPRLPFDAKPLSWYIMRSGQRAEREQLPTLDAKGEIVPFRPAADLASTIKFANDLLATQVAERRLTLVCGQCGIEHQYYAMGSETAVATVRRARMDGWVYDYRADPVRELCPECAPRG